MGFYKLTAHINLDIHTPNTFSFSRYGSLVLYTGYFYNTVRNRTLQENITTILKQQLKLFTNLYLLFSSLILFYDK